MNNQFTMDAMTPVCIVHTTDDDAHCNLTSPRDMDSWSTLLRAARLRQHQPILTVAGGLQKGELPQIHYHLNCRKLFTMKRDLDILEKKNTDEVDVKRRSIRQVTSSSSSRIMERVCIFCPTGKYQSM